MMRMKVTRNNLKLKGGMKGVKFLIFIFSFIFLVFGIKMIVIGSLLNVQFKDYLDFQGSTSISDAALFIVAFGSLVTFISFFGCTGSIRESRCMILTFSTLLVITFFCELALVFIGFSLKDRMYQILQEEMIKSINSTKPGIMKTWNVIQREFECCGFLGAEDWQRRGSAYTPNSCCASDLRCPNEENPLFADGCYEVLTKWTSNNLSIMTSVILIISILQIFGTMFSCLLAKNIKRGYDIVD